MLLYFKHFTRQVTKHCLLAITLCAFTLSCWAAEAAKPVSIMVLGDSISAAFGIAREDGWVNLLDQHLINDHPDTDYKVINASISGETTGGGLSRLPKLLANHKPNIVIIELGGNDGLRGYPIKTLRGNLDQMVSLSKQANARVLVAGMQIPPNYGPRYTQQFYDSFGKIAQKYDTALLPFLLEGIALSPGLMQKDGIHPTAPAQPLILQNVLPHLKELL
ncbi:arylesterase [Oceanicoccus sagamiensis]|uniref:Arylesterase n=1 Tax=Oceanicoccus sagamiensis TaxID=716816 RepID=A0A1X9NKP8_9GAMM|nr:arylesterase [Oceanicoccus sagamiensis]ARN76009.1 arylesterase [Oceanicoccus sagamiensis]